MDHQHSYWLDFDNDKVECSRLGCKEKVNPSEALANADSNLSLEIAYGKLKGHDGKVYVIKINGKYLCSITGYTRGVLHLLDFTKPEHFDFFKKAVTWCFGVNYIQIQKERENV